jgi:hypothetical protein
MAYIGRQLARGENKLFDDISSSFNGSTTTFTLAVSSVATATATPYQLFVSLGGVMQKPNTDFTTAGNQITFTTAPAAGLSCWIMMQGDTIDQAAIPDASVTPSKISGTNFAFSGDLRLKDADGSHYVGFASPTTVASNKVWTLPAADGSASQYLQTNGSGVLSWASVTIGGASGIDFNDNVKARWGTGNDLEIFHNASNSVINDAGTGDLLLQVGGSTKATVSSTGFDITGALTVSTNAVITGNLTVSGTTTTINTQTLDVEDKNVVIGKVSSPSDTTADGGGWTLKGATDKTFNWINATDAWTSSEHIHLIDNKKLFVGGASGTTDGLEIVHNASDSILNDTGTGALKLQLGGSTKLEIQSGGINVTGAINVNGSALSTAPQITATADGAITAGKTCIITTAGKAKQVAAASVVTNPVVRNSGSEATQNATGGEYFGGGYNQQCAYDPDSDTVAICNREHSNGNAKVYLYSTNGDNLVFRNVTTVKASSSTAGDMSIVTLPNRRYLVTYYDSGSSGTTRAKIFTVNANADGWSGGSEYSLSGVGNNYYGNFGIHTTGGRVVFACRGDGGGGGIASGRCGLVCGDAGTTGSVWTFRSVKDDIFGETAPGPLSVDYDSANDVIGVMAARNNATGMNIIGARVASGNTATISNGTKYALASGSNTANDGRYMVKYHADQGTWLAAYFAASNGPIFVHTATINSSLAVSNGSKTSMSGIGGGPNGYGIDITNENRIVIGWLGNAVVKFKQLTLSGTTLTALSGETEILNGQTLKDRFVFRYMGHNGLIAAFASRQGNGFCFGTADTTVPGSNMTTENYIGMAASTVSDGAAATIDVSGATNSSQSSLTPGQKYYVQADGTLGLTEATPKVFAGTAVAATKIIVNDQQPIYVPPAGWTTLTSGTTTSGNSKEITTTHLTSSYQLYRLTFDIRGSLNLEDICYIQQYSNSAWQASNYRWTYVKNGAVTESTTDTGIPLIYPGKRWQGVLTFSEPDATDTATFYKYYGCSNNDNGGSNGNGGIKEQKVVNGCGGINDNTATTGLRFKLNGGSNAFTRGWFILEGLAIS